MLKFSDFSLEDRKLLQAAYIAGLRTAIIHGVCYPTVLAVFLNENFAKTNFIKITINEIEGFKTL